MPAPLTCILSYGLMCSPAEVLEVPPPAALEPIAAEDDGGDDGATPTTETPTTAPPKGAASIVLTKVQGYYDKTDDMKATFTQTYIHGVYGTKDVNKGTLKVKKPGKMVWDYSDEKIPDIWVNDKTVNVVERDTKQVVRRTVDKADFAGAEKFLFGGSKLIDDFKVRLANDTLTKRYGKTGHTVIELAPKKKNPHYDRLLLVVDDGSGRVSGFIVRNSADKSTNHFELTDETRNSGQPAGDFVFKKPKGFIIIDG